MVNGEMRPSGISQELELREFSELLFGSQDDSRSARWFSTSQAPDAGSPAQGVHTSMGWARENWVGSNSLPVSQRVHRVSRILRWVFNRAWVVEPVWRKES
jgi:hypothetical protein